jgi:protein ImuB
MPLAEAAALVERSLGERSPGQRGTADPRIEAHDPAADLAALARLAEHCERFSPLVGWETADGSKSEVASCRLPVPSSKTKPETCNLQLGTCNSAGPDGLFLDVTGIGALFGGEEKLAEKLLADLAQLGYDGCVAIADTIGAAWAGARQRCNFQVPSCQFQVLKPGPTGNRQLAACNLELLRLPPATLDLLGQLGIERLDQLLALPRESLRSRFGERLLLRIDQFLGKAQEIIVPHRPPPQFIEERLLDDPVERRDIVEQVACELVACLGQTLAQRRAGAVRLVCRLDCAPGRPLLLEAGLFRPSADAEHLWDLVRMQLEQTALPGPVGRLRVEAPLTAPLENRQGELFAGGEHEARRQLAMLIDRCTSRLGSDTVLTPEPIADPLPERAVRWKSQGSGFRVQGKRKLQVAGSKLQVGREKDKTRNLEPGTWNRLLRPLLLYSPPRPLAAVSIAPEGPPLSFKLAGQTYAIACRWGPERIETGWWRGKSIRRDYWRVETTVGQRFWIFRQLPSGAWFLHGEYG